MLTPELSYQIMLHGFLLWTSMGFLMPIGILIIRMSYRQECRRRLKIILYIHATLQVLSLLLVTAAAIMSIRSFENYFKYNHQRIGLALYGVIWLQTGTGFLRPDRGSKGRSIWFSVHWLLGITVSLLGIINIYTGLQAYHTKTLRSTSVWNLTFTVEIAVIVFIYLLQQKWHYIMQSGVILGNEPVQPTDQETSSTYEKKELSAMPSSSEPC
ncbi:cytochrome b561 domain-containing protein At4g18260-like isoform X1 [Nicotiana sylvestris]|uniref:Cytochrome b561 domain-containing protein At4g18260-like isoform X1 n=1 Tax=Nicotiana sylvestris TaxID=4096 RepID=A0A1U7WCG2_NICSY|nr:PREDICTED: cytochrome b561 domain-containing protein At4g18260-like isoform X1 [Nicotiana sylvestris]